MQPAPPRLLTWGAPLLLVALFGAVLLAQLGGASPTTWTQRQINRVAAFLGDLSEQLQPELSIATRPFEESGISELASQPQPQAATNADDPAEIPAQSEGDDSGQDVDAQPAVAEATVEPAEEPAPPPIETPTEIPTETPTSEPTSTEAPPTETPTGTPTSTPTVRASGGLTSTARVTAANVATVTATMAVSPSVALALTLPTPTPPAPTATPNIHRIRAGDTLFEIALANDISLAALLAANGLNENDVYTIQPGDEIIIPDPNAPAEPPATATPTPTPTQAGFTYTVKAGDTLMALGLRFGVNVQRILDANDMTLAQARTLRPGQELIIPGDAPATATPTPQPTAAAAMPTGTPTTAAALNSVRLDAPVLRSPENRVAVQCGAGERLIWNAVSFIQPNDLYIVHLGYVNGRDANGADQIFWVIAQQRLSNVTSWQLDDSLCGLAPSESGRQWRWYVDVVENAVDGTLTPVSPPSETWGFTWQ